ncbi:MAG: penicillin-binding protein 2 [Alphaproteobacteria bacterium]
MKNVRNKATVYDAGCEIEVSKSGFSKGYGIKDDAFSTCKTRLFFVMSIFLFVFVVLTIRVFDVCLSNQFNISHKTIEEKHLAYLNKNPIKRADIVDRNGIVLATSLPTVNLYANPSKILNAKETAIKLSAVLPDMLYEDILEKLQRKSKFIYLKRNLTPSQQYQINALGIPGLDFEDVEKRVYPHSSLLSHLLGTTNIDNKGVQGLERFLDERLQKSDIPLELSIDAGIQDTIRTELYAGVKKFSALGGTAILMDVKTAEVISMVSLPDFDPNNNNQSAKNKFNFATSGVYEPGSVLKVFNAALGLESGEIKMSDSFDATKPIKLKYNTIKDYRGENRVLSLQEVLVYSSNIGSAHIGLKVGKKAQQKFMKKIGFLDKIDIETFERQSPITPRRWEEETVATISYGYGISLTPMHLITAFSAVVNGGIYNNPSFIKKTNLSEGKRIISEDTSKKMRQLLRGVVVDGSGKGANVRGYEIAGKTGTANKLVDGKYINGKVMTSFLSTFPASNPKYALFVMLDEPKATKDTWGFVTSGWNTVPTTRKIIEAIAPQLNIQANEELLEDSSKRIIEVSYQKK